MDVKAGSVKCRKAVKCRACPERCSCPKSVRRDKISRRPMSNSAGTGLLARAAGIMNGRWVTTYELATALYGDPPPGRSNRMNWMVRARRPINKLRLMGAVAVRMREGVPPEYTLLPDCEMLC